MHTAAMGLSGHTLIQAHISARTHNTQIQNIRTTISSLQYQVQIKCSKCKLHLVKRRCQKFVNATMMATATDCDDDDNGGNARIFVSIENFVH